METGKNKFAAQRRLIIALLCVLLSVGATVGAVFAFTRLAFGSDEQTIVASNIYFKVNSKTFRDEITQQDLSLARGQSRDVDLNVEFLSGGSESAVDYAVELKLGEGDNGLARAVEVYRKTDGGYEFFGMLGELAGYTARGMAVANQPARVESFRFVYSPAAGDAFENTSFSLGASVTGEVTTSTVVGDVVYVNDLTPLTAATHKGRTVRLMKDVTLTEDLTLDAPVLLDLNGRTLTVDSGKTLTVDYADGADGSAYKTYGSLAGIVDSKTGGAVVGSLRVQSCGSDLYLLGDGVDLSQAAVTFADGVLRGGAAGFFDAVTYNYENRVAGKTFTAGETVPLLANLARYLDPAGAAGDFYGKFTLTAESGALAYDATARAVVAQNVELTNNYAFELKNSAADGGALAVRGGVAVRGSSAYAVAEAYVSALPEPVTASLFFPTFDRASGLALTWIVDDGCGGRALDADGVFLKGGYDGLDDWSDRTARIALTASEAAGGSQADAVGDYHVSAVTRRVVVMSEELRTEKLFAVGQLVVEENIPYKFADYLDNRYYAVSADGTVNKANLTAITVELGDEGAKYLAVTGEGVAAALEVVKVPDKTSASFDVAVTFHYTDTVGGAALEKTYAFGKSVLVLGYTESVTIRNAQSTIQSWLDDTEYVKNNGGGVFDLTVPSYLSGTGDFLEYSLPAGIDYLFVRDDVYVQNASGRFYKTDGGYKYFAAYYTTAGATADDYDVVLGSGADARYYKATENKNGAVIIIGGTAYAYDGGKNCYDRCAVISVLPEKVPPYDVDVGITARVYRLDAQGNKLYCRADGTYSQSWSDANPRLEYSTLLTVRGIYHNNADEIADSAVYETLRGFYDLNGDGFIGRDEARAVFIYDEAKKQYTLSLDGVTSANGIYYDTYNVVLSNKSVGSLKGLEYFTNARAYNLANNKIADLTPLAALNGLELLYLSNNLITDISALSYLDELQVLDLSGNNITDISALEYLRKLYMLALPNNAIADFMPLSAHKSIAYLDVRGNAEAQKLSARYAYAQIYENNKNNADFAFYVIDTPYSQTNPYSQDIIDNADSLRRFNEIGQVYKTVHLPVAVGDRAVTWYSDSSYLTIGGAGAAYYDVTIVTPPVDTAVTLTAHVGAGGSEVSRSFAVLLLSDRAEPGSNELYLETAAGVYLPMSEAVPDKALRSLLASLVNSADETVVDVGGGTVVNGLRAITMAEIAAWAAAHNAPQLSWAASGIVRLDGIGYFASVFDEATLDLTADSLTDLTPLAQLKTLKTLRLGGMRYDFSQLGGLTALESLYVYECYGLSDEETIGGLYNLYIANAALSIYKDSATEVWDPYAELMPRYVRSLPSFYAFMDAGDSYTLLGGAVDADGKAFCTFTFYGNTVKFVITSREVKGANNFGGSDIYNTVTLTTPAARDTTSYARYTLSGYDGRGTVEYGGYYVELLAEGNARFLVDDNGALRPLTDVFTGYTIRTAVLKKLYADSSLTAAIAAAKASGGYCTVPAAKFAAMSLGALTVDGTYESDDPLGGLQYLTQVTNLTLARDANLGDGSGLKNITDLTIKFSFINFSSIATPLPKLKNLTISGSNTSPVLYKKNANAAYYELKYSGETYLVPEHDYYLRWFTGLETLTLNDNNKTIGDWTFLFGLLFADDGNGQKLNVSSAATSGLKYGDGYVTHKLKTLNAYNNPNTYLVTTAAGGVLTLGTLNGNVSGTFATVGGGAVVYDPPAVGFGIVGALFRASSAAVLHYKLIAGQDFTMADRTYSFAVDPAIEYKEFNAAVTETGAKVNGELLSQLDDQSVTGGDVTLSLPLTTYAYTGTDFGDDNYFTRAFGIKWSLYGYSAALGATAVTAPGGGMTAGTHSLGFGTFTYAADFDSAWPATDDYREATLNISLAPAGDYYVLVVGTIGEYYFDNHTGKWQTFEAAQTQYTFVYPLLVKNSTVTPAASFANIEDTALRFMLFCAYADGSYDGTLDHYKNVSTQIRYNYNGGSLSNYTNQSRNPDRVFSNVRTYNVAITNLTGLDILSGLTSVSMTGLPLSNIDALGGLTKMTVLNLTSCGVTYVPDLSQCTELVEVSFIQCNINDLSNLQNCKSLTNLTTLTLTANDVTAAMLKYLYDPQTGDNNIPTVQKLTLTANQCLNEFAMIEWVYLLTGGDSANTSTLKTLNGWTVDKTQLTELRTQFADGLKDSGGNTIRKFAAFEGAQSWQTYCASVAVAAEPYTFSSALSGKVISAGQFAMEFAGDAVYKRVNVEKNYTATLKIYPTSFTSPCWLTSSAPLYESVAFFNSGNIERFVLDSDGQTKHSLNEFDGDLLAYLLSTSNYTTSDITEGGANYQVYVFKSDFTTLKISTDFNIMSLRGINYLGFSSVTIEKNQQLSTLWNVGERYDRLTSLTLKDCRLKTAAVACLADATNCKIVDFKLVRGVDYSQLTCLSGVQKLTVGGTGMWKNASSVRAAYIGLLNGTYSIGGATVNNLTSFGVDLTNKNANGNTSWNASKVYVDSLAYFYAQAQTVDKYADIQKLLGATVIYNSNDLFYTLSNADFGAIFTIMGGDERVSVTDGTVVTRYKLPVGETVSYNDLSNPMVFSLPVSVSYGGKFDVEWQVIYAGGDVTEHFITFAAGKTVFTLSAADINAAGITASPAELTLRAVLTSGAKSLTKDGVITISDITSSSSSTSDAVDYEYYVETAADGTCAPADTVFASGRLIEWIFGGSSGVGANSTKYNNNGVYTSDAHATVTYGSTTTCGVTVLMTGGWGIKASDANKTFNYNGAKLGDNAVVLTYDFCQRLYSLDTTNTTIGNGGNSMGITSIAGVEVFANLAEMYFVAGNFTDLSPLAGLRLKLFSYQNAGGGNAEASYITDFSPLVKGSAGSLEVFVYDTYAASVQPRDMTFLLAFVRLKEAYLFGSSPYSYNAVGSGTAKGDLVQYLAAPSFSYLVSALAKTDARLYLGAATANKAPAVSVTDFLASSAWREHYDILNVAPAYSGARTRANNFYAAELRPKDSSAATDALASFDKAVNADYGVSGGYALTLNGGRAAVNADGNILTVKAKLPALLNAGYLYAIDWQSGSSHMTVDGYGVTGSLTVGDATYDKDHTFASQSEFAAFVAANEAAVYNAMNTGAFGVWVDVTLTLPGSEKEGVLTSDMYRSYLSLILKTEISGTAYERMLSVDIAATLNAAARA